MKVKFFLSWIIGPTLLISGIAHSSELCVDAAKQKDLAIQSHHKWKELTRDQWMFLRGIYAMNPLTPPGLPFGDRAVLITKDDAGLILFLDGTLACTPMTAPKELRNALDDLESIPHEGKAL